MNSVTVGLVICLLVCSDLWLVNSKTSETDSTHQCRLARQAREIRSHRRETRQTRESNPDAETKCRYKVALLDFPPYIMNVSLESSVRGFMYEKIKWFVDTACFDRTEDPEACIMDTIFVRNSTDMIKLIKEKGVDFAFPIQEDAKTDIERLSVNVTLFRAFVSSGCSMIVNIKQCVEGTREQLLTSITSQWPILACIILLSGISGVVIWLLEHRSNKAHFSPSFAAGSPEGFWWAFVSLTTVGYGDKTPKTFLGRLFAIIWILIGAIMLSLFTAMVTNSMNAALDGTQCKDIDGKEVGVSMENTETQIVAKAFNAKIVKFNNLEEIRTSLREGIIGRVLVDRNTAFHFLAKSGLKGNRQIRLIRNIDYPMDYFLAYVNREVVPATSLSPNHTNNSDTELTRRKSQLSKCGPKLKENSRQLLEISKETATNILIPAELQTADLLDQMDGLFSTGSEMTQFILFSLLGVFLVLIIIGILWEVYTKCNTMVFYKRRDMLHRQHGADKDNQVPLNRKMYTMHNFLDLEKRLKDLTADVHNMKEEFARIIMNQEPVIQSGQL